jgi:hypothetical protein
MKDDQSATPAVRSAPTSNDSVMNVSMSRTASAVVSMLVASGKRCPAFGPGIE